MTNIYSEAMAEFTKFAKYVKILRNEKSKNNLSWRSIRKSIRKDESRKKLNRQIYHMVSIIIPNYFPEILDNTKISNSIETVRYNSMMSLFKEDPFTQEFKDVIRRIKYNKFHNKNKPVPPIDTIKLFTTKWVEYPICGTGESIKCNNGILDQINKYYYY